MGKSISIVNYNCPKAVDESKSVQTLVKCQRRLIGTGRRRFREFYLKRSNDFEKGAVHYSIVDYRCHSLSTLFSYPLIHMPYAVLSALTENDDSPSSSGFSLT